MAKIICLAALLFVMGCRRDAEKKTYQDLQTQGYSLVFGNDFLDIQFNLENDSLKSVLPQSHFVYRDTMHLSDIEKNEIASCFFEQNINEFTDLIDVIGKNFSYPIVANNIYIYRHQKRIAILNIPKRYEPAGLFPDRTEKRIVKFRDDVWKILNNKRKYQIAKDSLTSALKKEPIILL